MTQTPDDPDDPAESGSAGGDPGAGRKLDEDAAWRDIVAHYGDRPELDEPGSEAADPGPRAADPESGTARVEPPDTPDPSDESREERLRGLFQPSWSDPLDSEATWEDEGHFTPPAPPPMPELDPRRRLAWFGLFGSPVVMLVAVVLGWSLPNWLMFCLAVSFAGGFVYLVATMPNRRPGDGSGGDGAVV